MNGKAMILFIFILSVMVGGCTNRPVFSVEVLETPTPILTELIASPATQDLQPAATLPPFPSLTPTTTGTQPDFSPILYGEKYDANTFFILLGGMQAGEWLSLEEAAASLRGAREYDVYPFKAGSFQVEGYTPEFSPPNQAYFIGTNLNVDGIGMVGVAHGWPVRQGKPQELTADNETYKQIVLDWLKTAGISNPALGTLQIFRIDLEGDGIDEVFISATHLDESQHTTQRGDYSIVLMRKVTGNEAATLPVVADIYTSNEAETSFPRSYTLANFIDLNQDGLLEVVVDYQRWEGDGALLFEIDGGRVTQIP